MDIQVVEKITDRNYPYMTVHGVRTDLDMPQVLGYCDMTVDEVLQFVAKIHPELHVYRVTNFVEA
jgi:hypothetical protein